MHATKLIADRGAARAQRLPARQGRSIHRIGILSFSSPGHFYPLTALGRRLQSRGHEVVYFQVADLERPIRAAGLQFRQIGREDFPPGSLRARDEEVGQLRASRQTADVCRADMFFHFERSCDGRVSPPRFPVSTPHCALAPRRRKGWALDHYDA